MKAQIYINRHVVAANKKATKETGELTDRPAISVHTYKGSIYAKEVEFTQGCKLIQNAADARCSGATIWLECNDFKSLIIDGVEGKMSDINMDSTNQVDQELLNKLKELSEQISQIDNNVEKARETNPSLEKLVQQLYNAHRSIRKAIVEAEKLF